MATTNIGLITTGGRRRVPARSSDPARRLKKSQRANAAAASGDDALTGIPIRHMVWDGFVQQTGMADMDWALER